MSPEHHLRTSTIAGRALVATAVLLVVAVALRLGTRVGGLAPVWDEPLMQPVVAAIVEHGWTAETAIDYEDTKGPAFFWGYAALGRVFGADVPSLRLVTLALFVLAGIPLGVIAALCAMSATRTAALAALYALLPYNAVLGQLFMSEPSYLLGALALAAVFLAGLDAPPSPRRSAAIVTFAVLLSALLHHRAFAAALGGAAVLVAGGREGRRSWPWWLALFVAGLSRLPLFVRWGGMVSPAYQDRIGLGLRLDSLTYLAIALLPCTLLLLRPALADRAGRRGRGRWWRWIAVAAVAGGALGVFAAPDLGAGEPPASWSYRGMTATVLRPLEAAAPWAGSIAVALLSALGAAALAAMVVSAARGRGKDAGAAAERLAAATVLVGWLLFALTRGVVYDRYLLSMAFLLPVIWIRRLPPWLLLVQGLALLVLLLRLAAGWLT